MRRARAELPSRSPARPARRQEPLPGAPGPQVVAHPDGGVTGVSGHHSAAVGEGGVELDRHPLRPDRLDVCRHQLGRPPHGAAVGRSAIRASRSARAARRRPRSRSSSAASSASHGQPRVAQQPDDRLVVAADLVAVDVDLDERRIRRERPPGVGAVLVGARPDEHDHVGIVNQPAQVVAGRGRAPCSSRSRPATAGAARPPSPCPSWWSRPAATARSCRAATAVGGAATGARHHRRSAPGIARRR